MKCEMHMNKSFTLLIFHSDMVIHQTDYMIKVGSIITERMYVIEVWGRRLAV